mgnify:CR=1 FL=1
MGSRKEIVLNYNYDENWIGGTYYVQNLIHSLQTLPDAVKPILYIKPTNQKVVEDLFQLTSYPYLKAFALYNDLNLAKRALNKLSNFFLKKEVFPLYNNFDAEFPIFHELENLDKKIFWIPDFQEKHLPHFFTEADIKARNETYLNIQTNAKHVIFTSEDARKAFHQSHPHAKPPQFVLNFASYHQNKNLPSKESVLKKFEIRSDYFLCSNQFWEHKNHIVILKAIALLKEEGCNVLVIFTGKEKDHRNPDYFENLKKKIEELGIEENVKFLGFIDREDQIILLQNCKSIIQPSLFEGWSTVNEDAKAENAYILASNIKVNQEQLQNYPNYQLFDPYDDIELANQIKKNNFATVHIDYNDELKKFGENFLRIIQSINK